MGRAYKWVTAVAFGLTVLSTSVALIDLGYTTNNIHLSPKTDWGTDDKTSIDDAEDSQVIEHDDVTVVLLNGIAKPLEGVPFILYSEDNKEIGSYVTDSSGEFLLKNLQYDKIYHIREAGVDEEDRLEQSFALQGTDRKDYPEGVRVLKEDNRTLSLIHDATLSESYNVKVSWKPPIGVPKSVRVNLYRNGHLYDSIDLSKACDWKFTFTNLIEKGNYTVEEEIPANYEVSYLFFGDDKPTGVEIQNTLHLNIHKGTWIALGIGIGALVLTPILVSLIRRNRRKKRRRKGRK